MKKLDKNQRHKAKGPRLLSPRPGVRRGLNEPEAESIRLLIRIGGLMSNVCFNLSQQEGKPIETAAAKFMRGLQKEWDNTMSCYQDARKLDAHGKGKAEGRQP